MNSEEEDSKRWDTYAWEVEPGYTNVSALYSPWQLLYVDHVLRGTAADISVQTHVGPRFVAGFHPGSLRGTVDREDVLLFEDSLEASNASAAELVELAREIAANPPPGREPAELRLDPDSLEKHHADRCARAPKGGAPGLAESLIDLARREEHGSVELDKLELVEALARLVVGEMQEAQGDRDRIVAITERRPVVRFVFDRVIPMLNRPRPAELDV
jgi:hypothetical protein